MTRGSGRARRGLLPIFMLIGVLWGGFASPGVARAEDDAGFSRLMDEGLDAYRSKKYEQAAQRFEAAYAIRPEPELVYNIARSYEKALKGREAIEAYERFLKLPGTTADLRSNALAALEALKREQDALAKSEAPSKKRRPARPIPNDEAELSSAPAAARTVLTPSATPAAPTRARSRALEWTLIGVGGAGIAAGAAFGGFALQKGSEFDRATTPADRRAYRNDAKLNALIADVALAAGVLTAGVGAALLLFLDDDTPVAVAPSVGPGQGTIAIGGTF